MRTILYRTIVAVFLLVSWVFVTCDGASFIVFPTAYGAVPDKFTSFVLHSSDNQNYVISGRTDCSDLMANYTSGFTVSPQDRSIEIHFKGRNGDNYPGCVIELALPRSLIDNLTYIDIDASDYRVGAHIVKSSVNATHTVVSFNASDSDHHDIIMTGMMVVPEFGGKLIAPLSIALAVLMPLVIKQRFRIKNGKM
ncbi:MAG: hypothetical protein ABI361_11170 [Nitrososphaera sp.]